MSQNTISITFKLDGDANGFKKLTMDADGFKKIVKATVKESEKLKSTMINLAAACTFFDSVNRSLSSLNEVLKNLTAAYAAQRTAETQLETAMRNTMEATDEEIQSIKDLCSAQQQLGVVGDEVQLAGAQKLATFLAEKQSLEQLIPAMNDLVVAQYGLDATQENTAQIATALGKAMEGQTNALKRYGLVFDDTQARVMKYGDEAMRAAVLSEVVKAKVGGMNEELAKTDAGRQKQLDNTLGDIKERLGSIVQKIQPFLTMAATTMIAFSGVIKLGIGIKTMITVVATWHLKQKALNAMLIVSTGSLKKAATAMRIYGNAAAGSAAKTKILTMALRGLGISLGIGAAIGGLIALIGNMTDKNNQAVEAAEAAAEAVEAEKREFEEWKKSLTDLSRITQTELAKEMAAIDRLYRAATDETKSRKERIKAANELKNTYKDTFANLTTEAILAGKAAKAYDELKNSVVAVARVKAAQAMLEDNEAQWIALDVQKGKLEKDLKPAMDFYNSLPVAEVEAIQDREMRNAMKMQTDNITPPSPLPRQPQMDFPTRDLGSEMRAKEEQKNRELEMMQEVTAAGMDVAKLQFDIAEIEKKQAALEDAREELQKYIGDSSISTNTDDVSQGTNLRQKLEKQMAEAKERYIKASIAGNEAEMASSKAVIDNLRQQIEQIESYEAIAERPASLTTLKDINAEIKYQQKLRETASKENIADIDAEIERLEEQKKVMESSKVKPIDQIKTYEELDATLQHYQNKMQKATEAERVEIQEVINLLDKLRQSWDEALTQAPGEIATLDTLKKLSDAISYYENKMQNATASEIAGYQKTLALLRQKQTLMQRSGTIIEAQQQVDSINSVQGMDWYVKVNAIGFDTLRDKIREIQALLNDTKNPLSDDMRIQAEGVVEEYKRMRVASLASNQGLQKVWGTTKGVAGGLQSMKSALTESDDAWSKVAGTIDSAIQIYESVRQVIDILSAITDVLTLKKKAEKVATDENTVSTAEEAAAKVTASIAEQAASTANTTAQVQEAAAKTMSAHASIPWVGIAIGGAMIAAMLATMFALPKFADGGIAYGPTVGLFGEYPGASNNPEVVAPLNKLRSLIQPQGIGGEVVFKLKGRELRGVLRNVNNLSERS